MSKTENELVALRHARMLIEHFLDDPRFKALPVGVAMVDGQERPIELDRERLQEDWELLDRIDGDLRFRYMLRRKRELQAAQKITRGGITFFRSRLWGRR